MIGLGETAEHYRRRGTTGESQARNYRNVPPPRDAVRHHAARAPARHVADVPRRRRGPQARARARVGRVPRAPVRAVHEHADARRAGRHRAGAGVAAGHRRGRAAGRRRRARDRGAVRRRPRARALRGRRRRPSSRAARPPRPRARSASPPRASCSPPRTAAASRSAASSRSRPTTSRSPTSTARSSGARRQTTPPRCSPAFPDGLTTAEVAAVMAPHLRPPDREAAEDALIAAVAAGAAERRAFGNDALWTPAARRAPRLRPDGTGERQLLHWVGSEEPAAHSGSRVLRRGARIATLGTAIHW